MLSVSNCASKNLSVQRMYLDGRHGGVFSRGESRDKWVRGPSLQPDQEIPPKMFQERALRRKEASGLPLQYRGCKLRCLENSRARKTAHTVKCLVRGAGPSKAWALLSFSPMLPRGRPGLPGFHEKL